MSTQTTTTTLGIPGMGQFISKQDVDRKTHKMITKRQREIIYFYCGMTINQIMVASEMICGRSMKHVEEMTHAEATRFIRKFRRYDN